MLKNMLMSSNKGNEKLNTGLRSIWETEAGSKNLKMNEENVLNVFVGTLVN